MKKTLLIIYGLLVTCLPLPLNAQVYHPKIDSALLVRYTQAAEVECLIIMAEQADLGAAAMRIRHPLEKARFVHDSLSRLSAKTQARVQDVLYARQAPMKSFWIINAIWAKGDLGLIQAIADLPEVARIEDNPTMHLSRPAQDNNQQTAQERTHSPWGIAKINADDVWDLGFKGQGVIVGGQDTGYEWQHPAIKNQYRGWDGVSVNHNYNWHDAISTLIGSGANSCGLNLNAPCDDNAHGTHTAGTMVGVYGTDTIGVAPAAQWIGCRNMEEGDGTPATYIECFEWLAMPTDLNDANPNAAMKPHVINNSWGCPSSEGCNSTNYATMNTVVNNVRNAGILVVVSAGNSGSSCSSVSAPPAIFEGAFTVGATNSADGIASFSSRGPAIAYTTLSKPDVSAPGVGVYSCTGVDNNLSSYSTASWNGTSMAGPHVAGLAALVMSARPDLKGNVAQLELLIKNNSTPLYAVAPFCGGNTGTSRPNNTYGWGRVDALATVNAALVLPVEWVSFNVRAKGTQSELTWSTATEVDCHDYTVQRSANGIDWDNLYVMACRNNSNGADYRYIDPKPLEGINYYRLRQEDHDGAQWNSAVVSITFNNNGIDMRLQPLHNSEMLYIDLIRNNRPAEQYTLDLYSTDGKLLRTVQMEHSGSVVLEALSSGLYIAVLRAENGAVLLSKKFVWK